MGAARNKQMWVGGLVSEETAVLHRSGFFCLLGPFLPTPLHPLRSTTGSYDVI